MTQIIFLLILFGQTMGLVVRDNVIFKKMGEITTTQSKWTVTLVIDTDEFERVFDTLHEKIDYVSKINQKAKPSLLGKTRGHELRNKDNLKWFTLLQDELNTAKDKLEEAELKLFEYKTLGSKRGRRVKKSLIPFVGSALGFLFGTVSELEVRKISKSVQEMKERQDAVLHVLKESMTILNTSRIAISENRQKINEAILSIGSLDNQLSRLAKTLDKELVSLEMFLETYLRLDHIIRDIQDKIRTLLEHLQELRWKINGLALGRLTPSIVTPDNLKSILMEIQGKLGPTQDLPSDPDKNLFTFYEYLTCKTILENNRILVVISIPILDYRNEFDIYETINLPLPIHILKESTGQDVMTAHYALEAEAFAIKKDRTTFTLLSKAELEACSKPLLTFCAIQRPNYFVNKNKFCIISLFLKNEIEIKGNCHSSVKLISTLPQTSHLSDGNWVVSTHSKLKFSILCPTKDPITLEINPPLSVVSLEQGCTASNDFLSIPANIQRTSNYKMPDSLPKSFFNNWSNKTFSILEPIESVLKNFSSIKIPKELKKLKQIPMNNLVDLLQNSYDGKTENLETVPNWVCVVLVLAFVLICIIIVGTTCFKKFAIGESGRGCGSCGVGVTTVDLGEVASHDDSEDVADDAQNVATSTGEALQEDAGRRYFRMHPLFLSRE